MPVDSDSGGEYSDLGAYPNPDLRYLQELRRFPASAFACSDRERICSYRSERYASVMRDLEDALPILERRMNAGEGYIKKNSWVEVYRAGGNYPREWLCVSLVEDGYSMRPRLAGDRYCDVHDGDLLSSRDKAKVLSTEDYCYVSCPDSNGYCAPVEFCHGTRVSHLETILRDRELKRSTKETDGKSGLWHAPYEIAVGYAVPGLLRSSSAPAYKLSVMLRVRVKKHSKKRGKEKRNFVSKEQGDWRPVVMMLARAPTVSVSAFAAMYNVFDHTDALNNLVDR